MPITRDDVKPGVLVRVLRNECNARRPEPDHPVLVKPGDLLTLNGTVNDNEALYNMTDYGFVNGIPMDDVELVPPGNILPSDLARETAAGPIVIESALARAESRIDARFADLQAKVDGLRDQLGAVRAELERHIGHHADDGR